jgi:hypothetical protein
MKKISAQLLMLAILVLPFANAAPAEAAVPANWDTTGSYVIAFNYFGTDYNHDMSLVQDNTGNITGNGGNPVGANLYTWVLTSGTVSGDTIDFLANYTATPDAVTPQTVMHVVGTIAPNGTMSGTWADNYAGGQRGGTFRTVLGSAVVLNQCDTNSVISIVSDTQTKDITDNHNAVALTFVHPGWTASIPGATWIWATDPVESPTSDVDLTKKFTREFTISGTPQSGTLEIAADNRYTVSVNGDKLPVVQSGNNFQLGTQDSYDVTPYLVNGANRIEIAVTNLEVGEDPDPAVNPAGLLYKLTYSKRDCAPAIPMSISGVKYNDLNRNGKKDIGEPGLGSWVVRLMHGNTLLSTTTDANGNYIFSDLAPGVYVVRETHQTGWKRRSQNPKLILLSAGSVVTGVTFGNSLKLHSEKEDTAKGDDRVDQNGAYYTHHDTSNYETDQASSSHLH